MTDSPPRFSPVSETLKPCPFCGCDKIEIFYDHPDSVGAHFAGHYVSHPVWKKHPEAWGCWLNFGGKFETKEAAAEAWNSRFDFAQTPAEPVAWRHKHFPNEPWQYRENQTFGTPYPYYEALYAAPAVSDSSTDRTFSRPKIWPPFQPTHCNLDAAGFCEHTTRRCDDCPVAVSDASPEGKLR
jgi:hypothetical protein